MRGSNNNSTVRRLSAANKKLFVFNEMMDTVRGNCLALESVLIVAASSTCESHKTVNNLNASVLKIKVLDDVNEADKSYENDDYEYIPSKYHYLNILKKPLHVLQASL